MGCLTAVCRSIDHMYKIPLRYLVYLWRWYKQSIPHMVWWYSFWSWFILELGLWRSLFSFVQFAFCCFMAENQQHIPHSVKEHMIILSGYMDSSKVAKVCDVSQHTVNRVKHLLLDTGSVVREPLQSGQLRVLNSLDAMVSCCLFIPIHTLTQAL